MNGGFVRSWLEEKRVQVDLVERPIDNFVQVFISLHSIYWQVALASTYICISVCWASRKFLRRYTLHNFPFVHDVSRAITSEPWKSEKQSSQTLQHLLDFLRGLTILDLCSEGTSAKGVACKTRSEPSPSLASLAVGSTPWAKTLCVLTLLNVRNATSPCLRFCCTNNRIIISFLSVRMN